VTRPIPPRRQPERSCVACRTPRTKRELLRVVRTPEGAVMIDPTGRRPGRGAYLCRDAACWDLAGRRRALEHALRTSIPEGLLGALATTEPTPRVIGAASGSPDATHTINEEGGPHGSK
jgi:predicted RNA-binding protein YlxR (DUF448 family)